jgi:Domain of unknown function (DUF4326)
MDEPRVLNRKTTDQLAGAIYVGRPTKWGNPFVIGRDGTRGEVIARYAVYLHASGLIDMIDELRGLDLVCWCAPEPCHADVLVRYANADPTPVRD